MWRPLPLPLLLLLLAGISAAQETPAPPQPSARAGALTVMLRGVPFELEVAADAASRQRGLSGRARLEPRGGMLFVFPDDQPRSFWMRDCLIDLGLLFLDRYGRVLAVHEMRREAPRGPEESERSYLSRLRQYPSLAPARYAIEVREGVLPSLGITRGERIELRGAPDAAE